MEPYIERFTHVEFCITLCLDIGKMLYATNVLACILWRSVLGGDKGVQNDTVPLDRKCLLRILGDIIRKQQETILNIFSAILIKGVYCSICCLLFDK